MVERTDGHTDWVRWEMTPWYRADSSTGGALVFSEVVTARIQAAGALETSEERLRLATAAGGLGLFDWDAR
jgi:PAS domain-containing protein